MVQWYPSEKSESSSENNTYWLVLCFPLIAKHQGLHPWHQGWASLFTSSCRCMTLLKWPATIRSHSETVVITVIRSFIVVACRFGEIYTDTTIHRMPFRNWVTTTYLSMVSQIACVTIRGKVTLVEHLVNPAWYTQLKPCCTKKEPLLPSKYVSCNNRTTRVSLWTYWELLCILFYPATHWHCKTTAFSGWFCCQRSWRVVEPVWLGSMAV